MSASALVATTAPTPSAVTPSAATRRAAGESLLLRVVAITSASAAVRTVELAALDGSPLPSFTPGSHVVLHCGERRNAYSLTGASIEPMTYAVSVLHQPDGRGGSSWVHEALDVGEVVSASAPRSAFPPMLTASHHLFIAGGIGITAMLSHVRAALTWRRSFTLLYSYRAGAGAHLDELRELCGDRLVELVGRGATADHVRSALADQPLGTHLYTCGPGGLLDTVAQFAAAAGWPAQRVHVERFSAEELPPGAPFTARLASGALVPVPSGVSLLEALEGAGVAVANRCRQGVCGECRLPVRAGRVEHRDLYLSPEERAAGTSIMSCVSRSPGPTLELDL